MVRTKVYDKFKIEKKKNYQKREINIGCLKTEGSYDFSMFKHLEISDLASENSLHLMGIT